MTRQQRKALGARVEALGSLNAAAADIGVTRESLARAMAGLPVRRGTAMVIAQALAAVSGEASSVREGAR